MRPVFLQALLLLFASAALGLLINTLQLRSGSPHALPFIRPPRSPVTADEVIPLAAAEEAWTLQTAVFLDARAPADYATGHIVGAHNLPTEEFDQRYPTVAARLTPDQLVIVYCDGELCELSHDLARRLREVGHTNVKVLLNGWTLWQQAVLPTASGSDSGW